MAKWGDGARALGGEGEAEDEEDCDSSLLLEVLSSHNSAGAEAAQDESAC